jgi:hypothetical protein
MVAPSPEREESAARVAAGRRGSPIASPMPVRAGSTRSAGGVRPEAGGRPRPSRARTGATDGALAAAEAGPRVDREPRRPARGERPPERARRARADPSDDRPLGRRRSPVAARGRPRRMLDRAAAAGRIDPVRGRRVGGAGTTACARTLSARTRPAEARGPIGGHRPCATERRSRRSTFCPSVAGIVRTAMPVRAGGFGAARAAARWHGGVTRSAVQPRPSERRAPLAHDRGGFPCARGRRGERYPTVRDRCGGGP